MRSLCNLILSLSLLAATVYAITKGWSVWAICFFIAMCLVEYEVKEVDPPE